ncbi:hypothetical protein [Cryobacterium serini]|nr:hypothetical protein [Cryobacterium serini]
MSPRALVVSLSWLAAGFVSLIVLTLIVLTRDFRRLSPTDADRRRR